jgi:hypothetical protein
MQNWSQKNIRFFQIRSLIIQLSGGIVQNMSLLEELLKKRAIGMESDRNKEKRELRSCHKRHCRCTPSLGCCNLYALTYFQYLQLDHPTNIICYLRFSLGCLAIQVLCFPLKVNVAFIIHHRYYSSILDSTPQGLPLYLSNPFFYIVWSGITASPIRHACHNCSCSTCCSGILFFFQLGMHPRLRFLLPSILDFQ